MTGALDVAWLDMGTLETITGVEGVGAAEEVGATEGVSDSGQIVVDSSITSTSVEVGVVGLLDTMTGVEAGLLDTTGVEEGA